MLRRWQAYWQGSFLVQKLEAWALFMVAAGQDSWAGRLLKKTWADDSAVYRGSAWAERMGVVGSALLAKERFPTSPVFLYAIAFLLPLLPVLSTTIIIGAVFLVRLAAGGPLKPRQSLLRSLVFLFVAVGLIAALASAEPLASLRYWRYYLAGFLLTVLLMDGLETQAQRQHLLAFGLRGATVAAAMALGQYLGGMPTNLSWVDIRVAAVLTRVTGPFDNPNMFAAYLVAWLPFAVNRCFDRQNWSRRLGNFLVAGLLGLALLLTSSRGGWVAFAAALMIIVLYRAPRLLWVLPPLLLLAPLVLPPLIWQRLASIVNLEDTSNMVRLYVWDSSLKMFLANWWLGIGQGLAAFARVYPVFQYGVVPALHAHSLILQLAVEGGFLLPLLFIIICLALWRLLMADGARQSGPALSLGAALVGLLVHGVFDNSWYDLRIMLVFWLLLGLGAAYARGRDWA